MTQTKASINPESERKALTGSLPEKFNHKKNVVAIVECNDYSKENLKAALNKIVELLELKELFKNKSILLKPNALAPTKHTFTPPELVAELLDILKQDPTVKDLYVGDSTMTKSLTSLTLKRAKYLEQCDEKCSKITNFFESERMKVELKNPISAVENHIYLPKEVVDAELIINMPKLKTHKGYVYTGAIKNFFGLLGNKMNMHMTHKDKIEFQKLLADIYFAVEETNKTNLPKVLTIMDAVIAMEGKGPRAGKPKQVGLLIAGFNSAAVDMIGYTLMNGKPEQLDAIVSLANRTNLPVDVSQLEILGVDDYTKYIKKHFKKPSIATLRQKEVQDRFSRIANKIMSISIKINRNKCVLCEECVRHCPAEALTRKGDRIILDKNTCIECFCCGESCPNDAISAKWYIFRILPYLLLVLGFLGVGLVFGIWYLIVFLSTLF